MTDRLKNILIGLFVTAAFTIVISMILFLKPQIGDGKQLLHVRFANIAGITQGTRVTFAGKPVGDVIEIQEISHSREGPFDENGRIYCYELLLRVDSSLAVFRTDEIALRTTGLMGEKSVAILPKAIPPSERPERIENQVIYATSIDSLENTFQQINKVARRVDETVQEFNLFLRDEKTPLHDTLQSAHEALAHITSTLQTAEETDLLPAFKETMDLASDNLRLLQSGLDEGELLPKASRLLDSVEQLSDLLLRDGSEILKQTQEITQDLAQGNGTLGRLISGEDLYLRFVSVMNKTEILMNDLNHYGLLFQYDKHWQRGRTKRANLLQALQTPQEFKHYFEGELDIMTTSFSRLIALLEKQDAQEGESSPLFQKTFASLLRKLQDLADVMKLYNQEIIAKSAETAERSTSSEDPSKRRN